MSRQYVAVTFHGKGRPYTYHNDGEPVAVGDAVKLPAPRGDGWQRGDVVAVGNDAPTFATKPILGKLDPDKPEPTFPDSTAEL